MLKFRDLFSQKKGLLVFVCIFVGLLLVVGCRQDAAVSSIETPIHAVSPLSSIQTPVVSEEEILGPKFAFDSLKAGDLHVTGQGPRGIPIIIVDVSLTGKNLGEGFINSEGYFDISLSEALIEGHRIGIMAGRMGPMSAEVELNYMKQLHSWKGDHAMNIPMHIGFLFETGMVE
jgi:hypothetical protein